MPPVGSSNCGAAFFFARTVVIDEVHERQLDTDVLLGFLKQKISDYPNLCVILMSATLDSERFKEYWGPTTPHMHIPGRTFPVMDYMLEDVLILTGFIPPKSAKTKKGGKYRFSGSKRPEKTSPWNDSELSDNEEKYEEEEELTGTAILDVTTSTTNNSIPLDILVARVDETTVNTDIIACLVKYLIGHKNPNDDGSILIFLSGAPEINQTLETIKYATKDLAVVLLPLHGGLQPREQNRVFERAPSGFTKVVLSTNVAETRFANFRVCSVEFYIQCSSLIFPVSPYQIVPW